MSNSYIPAVANKPGFVPSQLAFVKPHPPQKKETAEIIVHNCKRLINNYGYAHHPQKIKFLEDQKNINVNGIN
jgi:hypothetical protein